MKRIVVTGSEGNVGRYVVRSLKARWPDADILRVTRGRDGGPWGSDVACGDLTDPAFARSLFHRTDAVFHAAATPYGPDAFAQPFSLMQNDIAAALSLFREAADAGVKHISLLSSATVYERVRASVYAEKFTETAAMPLSPLAMAKAVVERALLEWSKQTGGTHTIWRLFNVVSPAEPHDRPGHVYVDLYRKLFVERAKHIELAGGGRQRRCYTWVEDVAAAMAVFLDDERANNETFNLGAGQPSSVTGLVHELWSAGSKLGILPPSYTPEIVGVDLASFAPDQQARIPDIGKAKRVLGWTAPTSFEDCIRKFVEGKQLA